MTPNHPLLNPLWPFNDPLMTSKIQGTIGRPWVEEQKGLAAVGDDKGVYVGRGLHRSTIQLNLSRF
jgi:hypothetical protein